MNALFKTVPTNTKGFPAPLQNRLLRLQWKQQEGQSGAEMRESHHLRLNSVNKDRKGDQEFCYKTNIFLNKFSVVKNNRLVLRKIFFRRMQMWIEKAGIPRLSDYMASRWFSPKPDILLLRQTPSKYFHMYFNVLSQFEMCTCMGSPAFMS